MIISNIYKYINIKTSNKSRFYNSLPLGVIADNHFLLFTNSINNRVVYFINLYFQLKTIKLPLYRNRL